MQTWVINGSITADDSGNKLYNQMFFKFTVSVAGSHTIEVVPTDGGDIFIELNEKGTKTTIDDFVPGWTETLTKSFTAGNYVMSVGSLGGPASFTVKIN